MSGFTIARIDFVSENVRKKGFLEFAALQTNVQVLTKFNVKPKTFWHA